MFNLDSSTDIAFKLRLGNVLGCCLFVRVQFLCVAGDNWVVLSVGLSRRPTCRRERGQKRKNKPIKINNAVLFSVCYGKKGVGLQSPL